MVNIESRVSGDSPALSAGTEGQFLNFVVLFVCIFFRMKKGCILL